MAQYCRYCANMFSGDANYCGIKLRTFTDAQICRTNRCKDFELNPTDSLTGRTYRPRAPKSFEQLHLTEVPAFSDAKYTPQDSDKSPGLAGGISYKELMEQ